MNDRKIKDQELWCWHILKEYAESEGLSAPDVAKVLGCKSSRVGHMFGKVVSPYPLSQKNRDKLVRCLDEYLLCKDKPDFSKENFFKSRNINSMAFRTCRANIKYLDRLEWLKKNPPLEVKSFEDCVEILKKYIDCKKPKEEGQFTQIPPQSPKELTFIPVKNEIVAKKEEEKIIQLLNENGIFITVTKDVTNERILKIIQLIKDL